MQHAGLQYGQGAATSHQSPPFAHADIPQTNGGNTTSSLRQFRKKDGADKNSTTDLNTSVENSHIARVAPHSHYPARANDYYRYQHQYPDYSSPFKETPAQVKYSEIAETPQSIQHVDHLPAALQKHKEIPKDFMDMCNISQQTHMKQNYPDNLTRQQSYPPDAASVHHQYLHKEPQVHPSYKPESQYQQYPQIPKYNMPSQCRKYPPPPPENDFLAKLQRINPSMARSIMSDHHIRESQASYPSMDQNRMYSQNQRYYPPSHIQNNLSYNYPPYNNYPSSCNYKHPEYPRSNQMGVGGTQYPTINPHADRSISPRNLHMMNYGTSPQKISPNYSQYNPPEYAQHYQHRRASLPQEYYQQNCRTNPYMAGHQISPEPADNRGASGGLRHFIENWAEEEATAEITPIFKENIRIHNNDSSNEQVFVINSSDIPQCLENVSIVPTENGQYIIKAGALDNSVVRIKETTETNGERTVNLQIVEAPPKPDCMLAEESQKTSEETPTVPYDENQNQNLNEKDCDEVTKNNQLEKPETEKQTEVPQQKNEESCTETSVIVSNELSLIKDMPLIDEDHPKIEEEAVKEQNKESSEFAAEEPINNSQEINEESIEEAQEQKEDEKEINEETAVTRRTQRIFSVDDIINNIGSSPTETRRNSLQFVPKGTDEESNEENKSNDKEESEDASDEMVYRNAISVEDDSVILEIGGAWVQLNINNLNGTKVLSVLPLSESLVIDVNANFQGSAGNEPMEMEEDPSEENLDSSAPLAVELTKENEVNDEIVQKNKPTEDEIGQTDAAVLEKDVESRLEVEETIESKPPEENLPHDENLEEINDSVCQSEIVIGEESVDNEVFLDFSVEAISQESSLKEGEEEETKNTQEVDFYRKREEKRKFRDSDDKKKSSKKIRNEERKERNEESSKVKKTPKLEEGEIKTNKKNRLESPKIFVDIKKENIEEPKKKDLSPSKKVEKKALNSSEDELKKRDKEEIGKLKKERKLTPQSSLEEEVMKKKDVQEESSKSKRSEKKLTSQTPNINEEIKEKETLEDTVKIKKQEKKSDIISEDKRKATHEGIAKPVKKENPSVGVVIPPEDIDLKQKRTQEENIKPARREKKASPIINATKTEEAKQEENQTEVIKLEKSEKKSEPPIPDEAEGPQKETLKASHEEELKEGPTEVSVIKKVEENIVVNLKENITMKETPEESSPTNDVIQLAEKLITLKQLEENKEAEKLQTKAAKKLYVDDSSLITNANKESKPKTEENLKQKKSMSKLEETVNKIKSMKEKGAKEDTKVKKTSMKDVEKNKSPRVPKKVTFNLETEVREISKDEMDKKKLSLEEYNSRKRKSSVSNESEETKNKIMEDTVTSTEDINERVVEQVKLSIENTVTESKKSSPKVIPSNWENDTPSPQSPIKEEAMSTTNRKCIIDVNEFNIKPIESISTPSPVSSSQFSYHSEDDSLQVYKDVVDSKLNSLNIKIPKLSKPKPISVLLDRLLNEGSLNYEELEKVKKFIEIKRKMMEEEKKLTYEVRGERDYKDLKLHFRKVPEKRKKKRFRNLYAEETSDESDSSRSDKGVGNYSVYQRDSQGVPKLIFKRKSGLPQPFVKLERSQAVELLAKKRKLY